MSHGVNEALPMYVIVSCSLMKGINYRWDGCSLPPSVWHCLSTVLDLWVPTAHC